MSTCRKLWLAAIVSFVSVPTAGSVPAALASSSMRAATTQSPHTAHARTFNAASIYLKALNRVSERSRFTIKETFHFLAPQADRGRFMVRYVAPGQLSTSWWLLQSKPPSSIGPNTSRVRTTKSDLRDIVSNLMLPQYWIHNDGRKSHQIFQLMESGLHNFRISGRAATVRSSPPVRVDVLTITALGYPWGCGPSNGCTNAAMNQYWTNNNSYTGILTVDSKTGLPRRYSSTVTRFHHLYAGQTVTFSYGKT